MTWKNVPTRMIDVNGTPFAYRELGPEGGVPVVFLHHLMAVLDDWDPRVIDGIAEHHRVIAFDNRGIGRSGGKVPTDIEAAVIGADATRGVIDENLHVHGYQNLVVCDGSAMPANPGVNPALTITALAEHAMASIGTSAWSGDT